MADFQESEKVGLDIKNLLNLLNLLKFKFKNTILWAGAPADAGGGGEGADGPALLHEGRPGALQQDLGLDPRF